MRATDALAELRHRLEKAGVPFEENGHELHGRGEDWRRVFELFCALAREPAAEPFEHRGLRLRLGDDSDNDLLLHESGTSRSTPYWIDFRRQFGFEDERGEYAGMNALTLSVDCAGVPDGRAPQAQRWGYAGARREDVSDDAHPEMRNWAGWVDSWKRAVEASNSVKALVKVPPSGWRAFQGDI